ncbi:MAG: hypothetical protein AAB472_03255 [Patescibacteria group bacterium]
MRNRTQRYLILGLATLLILVTGVAYYFYTRASSDTDTNSAEETTALIAEVGKLIVLPQGEVPTVATVSDPEHLKNQPFFANAKIGDKVLLYATARKAYLYDPVVKKLIEVAPLNVGATTETETGTKPENSN